ncbi:hypothetical protein HMPREF1210_00546 [Paenisporosarcina sp. HGH0030]|nr:hypothetical protein HMPREF1210_00546 [Paenisporosarcina sp. HGH0030]
MVEEVAGQLVETLKETMCVKNICTNLGIARSTYYRWKQASTDARSRQAIERRIDELCREHKFQYGYRKITALLRQEIRVNHKVIQCIMQKYGWQCRVKMKKRKLTRQPYYFEANLLNRNFEATAPLHKLVIDITYLSFGQKQLYLSSIQDLYNGEIIAYSIGDCQDTDFVLNTLPQLDNLPEGCTPYSDQGSVYTSYRYQQAVKGKDIIMSMSHKSMPADNAPIESFHSALKSETFYFDSLFYEGNRRTNCQRLFKVL